MRFRDRVDAGQQLAARLASEFKGRDDVLLFALPRGGAALGALAETGETVWNNPAERDSYAKAKIDKIVSDETKEAQRRIEKYRNSRPLPDMTGKTAVIVDDGIATGATMKAAVLAAKHQHAKQIIIAVPHGAKDTIAAMRADGIEVTALVEPDWYGSVGGFYEAFGQVEDEEVLQLMKKYGVRG